VVNYVNPGSGIPISRYGGLEATEPELRRALSDPRAVVVEWENAGLTFVASERDLVIVRTGAMGGDVREVHGGWRYFNIQSFLKEWGEITTVAQSFRRGQGRAKG
jgi:hypothetical protein